MSISVRVIPCLDVDDGRVVKGVRFANLRDVGDPVVLAAEYERAGADELTFLDVTASSNFRHTMMDVVTRTAETVFIPLTVGGGVRAVSDVDRLLRAGADKVSVSTAAIGDPDLIREIADQFGRQVLVLSLDIEPSTAMPSGWEVTSYGGRHATGLDAVDWAVRVAELGAGELLVNSIAADGTKNGFDVSLIRKISEVVTVPIIASGGAGRLEHFPEAIAAGADAVLAATVFHFGKFTISQVKEELANTGFVVR